MCIRDRFTYAVKNDWLLKNPCSSVNQPKNPNKKPNEKSSKDNYWEIDEFNEFIDTVAVSYTHLDVYKRQIVMGHFSFGDLYYFVIIAGLLGYTKYNYEKAGQ